jgi:hypothetical protein
MSIARICGLSALDTPCSGLIASLCHGVYAGHSAAIVEMSAHTFHPEDGGRLGAYALNGEQHRRGF